MKKVCFITTVSVTLKTFVLAQAEYFKKEHPEWVIYFICDTDEQFAKSLPEYINYIPITMGRGVSLSGIGAVIKLTKIFKREKFDLVQYATPNAAFYASIAAKLAKIKNTLYCQWGIRYVGFSGVSRKLFKCIEKITCNLSRYINAVSPANKQFAVEEKLYKPNKAVVVGKGGTIGVDLNNYDIALKEKHRAIIRKELNLGEEFVIGFVGRLSKDKGTAELLSAVRKLEKSKKIKLLCIGPDEIGNEIDVELINWAKNSDSVVFTGPKKALEIIGYYAAMDVYVHPSYREGFGMVLQEAGAMALPIVTTNIPGASEVFEDGVSCITVEPKSDTALLKALNQLLSDAQKLKALGDNARKQTETYYKREIMLKQQLERYEQIMDTER